MQTKLDTNVVYIGDRIRDADNINSLSVHPECYVIGFQTRLGVDILMLSCGQHEPLAVARTPDKKLITGFGGAKIGIMRGESDEWWCTLGDNICSEHRWLDKSLGVAYAKTLADNWYGPWQRPFTESDLKRRGLM